MGGKRLRSFKSFINAAFEVFPFKFTSILSHCIFFHRKRPRLAQKATMFATVLNDTGKCAVAGTKPDYLPAECIQYLKDIDGLDSHINAPAVVSEQSWELLCKLRRIKIESELKV